MLFFVLQQGHKEKPYKAEQDLLVYSQLHIISSFLMGIFSVVLAKNQKAFWQSLLHPPFPSFTFSLYTEGGFSSEGAKISLT